MMGYLNGIFTIANVVIALFILVYANLFLTKTRHHRERRPWEYLFIASFLFLIFELISLLVIFNVLELGGVDIHILGKIFEFLYSGFVLLAFISQHDLILRNHMILISKKDSKNDIRTAEQKK